MHVAELVLLMSEVGSYYMTCRKAGETCMPSKEIKVKLLCAVCAICIISLNPCVTRDTVESPESLYNSPRSHS